MFVQIDKKPAAWSTSLFRGTES